VHTGQHYDRELSKMFFEQLEIPQPNYNLNVGSGSHGAQTGAMLARIEEVLVKERPDWALAYGDTNSTLAGALAAAKLHIPVAHIEAGLRSFNRAMPEEVNRVLTDHVSQLLFCPSQMAVDNLAREGITEGVHCVGDVMYDAMLHNIEIAQRYSRIMGSLRLVPKEYVLVTIHRPSNTENQANLEQIMAALVELDEPVVFPIHPRTRAALADWELNSREQVLLLKPVGYLDMLVLEQNARLILTDSGGVQKEAYWLGVPCLTLREETEWVETVKVGWNKLVCANADRIVATARDFRPAGERPPLYGDGHTSERIGHILGEVGLSG